MMDVIQDAVREFASTHPEALFGAQSESLKDALETTTKERVEAYAKYMDRGEGSHGSPQSLGRARA